MDYVDRARFFAILGKEKIAWQQLSKYSEKYPNGTAISVLGDYKVLIENPEVLTQVDKSILKKIKSKLTPAEAKKAIKKKKEKAEKKASNKEVGGLFYA